MWGAPRSQLEIANDYRTNFNQNNPQMRMSIITYLAAELDYTNASELLEDAQSVLAWVTAEAESFTNYVEGLEAPSIEDETVEVDTTYDPKYL